MEALSCTQCHALMCGDHDFVIWLRWVWMWDLRHDWHMRLVDLSIYSSIVADECNPDPAIILSMLSFVICRRWCCSSFVVFIMNDSWLDVLDLLRSSAAGGQFGTSVSACWSIQSWGWTSLSHSCRSENVLDLNRGFRGLCVNDFVFVV